MTSLDDMTGLLADLAAGKVPPKEERLRLYAEIRERSAALGRVAAALNLAEAAEEIRAIWPDAATVTLTIDHTERPAELGIVAVHTAAGDELWPIAEPGWSTPEWDARVTAYLINAYEWDETSVGEPVNEDEGFATHRIPLAATRPV